MTTKKTLTLFAAAGLAALTLATGTVQASQKTKNDWRNATAGSAAVLGYGLLTHNKTAVIVGAAGTAYSANRYEQDRHHQSQERAAAKRYHRYRSTSSTKYYTYHGHQYAQNLKTGHRYLVK